MSNALHPGIILILVGLIAAIVPKALRRVALAIGPLAALAAALTMPMGTDLSMEFFGTGYVLDYFHVDGLSYVFCMIFALMACIGGIYACHNESRIEAFSCMAYAGCALGVTLAKDWMTFIAFWEGLAVTSLFLIWCHHTPASRRAGYRYLMVHMLGGNLLLYGIFLEVGAGNGLVMNLAEGAHNLPFWAILIGIAVNAAIPPVNAWLVDAYPEGTITGSVFLSSFTTRSLSMRSSASLRGPTFSWLPAASWHSMVRSMRSWKMICVAFSATTSSVRSASWSPVSASARRWH